jgi:electron transfer flavoprotein beta subunit
MHVAVCIKQVPDMPSVRIDPERMTINREGVDSIINPGDRVALEAALSLKEREGGRITVITMGPLQSEEAVREAMAMGADDGILISDPALAGSDTWITSQVLARALKKLNPPFDLVLCGIRTMDSDTGHVGPQIAEALDLPQACYVTDIISEPPALVVRRVSEGFLETLRLTLPALLTIEPGTYAPRYIPFQDLEKAFSYGRVVRWNLSDLGFNAEEVGFKGSATQVVRLFTPSPRKKGAIVSGEPEKLVQSVIHKLEELGVLEEEKDLRGDA